MLLLDTNVVSQRPKARPNPAVAAWLDQRAAITLFLSAVSIHEIRFGIEVLPESAKRLSLEKWLVTDILVNFADRILPIDTAVADECGRLIARCRRRRHTPSLDDALIAATALVHGLKVATLNRDHFEPLEVELVKF